MAAKWSLNFAARTVVALYFLPFSAHGLSSTSACLLYEGSSPFLFDCFWPVGTVDWFCAEHGGNQNVMPRKIALLLTRKSPPACISGVLRGQTSRDEDKDSGNLNSLVLPSSTFHRLFPPSSPLLPFSSPRGSASLPLPAPRRLLCEVVAFHSLPAKRAGLWPPVKS